MPSHHRMLAVATACFLVVFFSTVYYSNGLSRFKASNGSVPVIKTPPPIWHHVAVTSVVGWHFEIYMDMASTFEKVLPSPGSVRVYRHGPFDHDFDKIINETGLFHHEFSDSAMFFADLNSTALYPEDETSPMIGLIVLGTCESDLRALHGRLLQSWDARPADKKFQIVCMFHQADDIQWHDILVEWVRRGAIRFLTISENVSRRLRRNFRAIAESRNDTLHLAGYEYIKIDTYIPVLDLPQRPKNRSGSLSNVAIQGSFRFDRREYEAVYNDLLKSLEEDPQAWGYLPLTNPDSVYEVDTTASLQPFHLHLIGNAGDPKIPHVLSNVVRVHYDLLYDEFYSVVHSMDLILPAFATLEYYEVKATFTMAIAIECNVPILVNEWMRQSYSFLDDRVTVTRPQIMREISAVKALRTSRWTPSLAAKQQEVADVNKMIAMGWARPTAQFDAFKAGIWAHNEEVMRRILNDS